MILRIQKGVLSPEEAHVTFPTDLGKVQTEMRGLEEFGKSYGAVIGVIGEGPAQLLNGRVKIDDLNTEAGTRKEYSGNRGFLPGSGRRRRICSALFESADSNRLHHCGGCQ